MINDTELALYQHYQTTYPSGLTLPLVKNLEQSSSPQTHLVCTEWKYPQEKFVGPGLTCVHGQVILRHKYTQSNHDSATNLTISPLLT